jgi:type IV pilus biogenesis protein CpaD/CtpE
MPKNGEGPVRSVVLAAMIALLSACSPESAAPPNDAAASTAALKRDCADPHWKEQNLGLWYSVCRTPMRW